MYVENTRASDGQNICTSTTVAYRDINRHSIISMCVNMAHEIIARGVIVEPAKDRVSALINKTPKTIEIFSDGECEPVLQCAMSGSTYIP